MLPASEKWERAAGKASHPLQETKAKTSQTRTIQRAKWAVAVFNPGPQAIFGQPLSEAPAPSVGKEGRRGAGVPSKGRRKVSQPSRGIYRCKGWLVTLTPGASLGQEGCGKRHHSDVLPFGPEAEARVWGAFPLSTHTGAVSERGGGWVVAASSPLEKDTHNCTVQFCSGKTEEGSCRDRSSLALTSVH